MRYAEIIEAAASRSRRQAKPESGDAESAPLAVPTISVGDAIRFGKFKNRHAVVKGLTQDAHNQPVLRTSKGDQPLFKPRLVKLMRDAAS